jgi:nucleotidyltransferase substrate binding protein (TIGR01987 family)
LERLKERLEVAKQALRTLQELESESYSTTVRDATIQRFEYCFEATWKVAKQYLKDIEGLEEGSPKSVIRACFQVGLLTQADTQQALAMTDDRNRTSHTYNESLAMDIYSRIGGYQSLMWEWVKRLEARGKNVS